MCGHRDEALKCDVDEDEDDDDDDEEEEEEEEEEEHDIIDSTISCALGSLLVEARGSVYTTTLACLFRAANFLINLLYTGQLPPALPQPIPKGNAALVNRENRVSKL